ncbi:hypothetical protein [Thalassotalea marina]|nr:hypothetical protein [Thalassotalea marina]
MIDSLFYIADIVCLIYLFHWAVKQDSETDSSDNNQHSRRKKNRFR